MSNRTIDTAMAKQMVQASAIRGAAIIGQSGGWSVMLKLGNQEKPLGTQRTDEPRLWRSLDRCVDYLKNELQLSRFDMLDATLYDSTATSPRNRLDTAERMKHAHEAAAYDKWFRAQVQKSLDDTQPTIAHEDVENTMNAKRDALRAKMVG
jgi:hypothetical protein